MLSGGLQSAAGRAVVLLPGATGTSLTLAPQVFVGWVGDSISLTSTTNVTGQYASNTRYVRDWAVSGAQWTTGDIGGQYTTNVTNETRIIAEGGVNDIRSAVSGATVAATSLAFVDARLAEGKQVVINNIAPWGTGGGWTPALQIETDDYNARLSQARLTRPTLIVVNLYGLLGSPGNPTILNPTYDSGDGLHPNTAGGAVWAAAVAAVSP